MLVGFWPPFDELMVQIVIHVAALVHAWSPSLNFTSEAALEPTAQLTNCPMKEKTAAVYGLRSIARKPSSPFVTGERMLHQTRSYQSTASIHTITYSNIRCQVVQVL